MGAGDPVPVPIVPLGTDLFKIVCSDLKEVLANIRYQPNDFGNKFNKCGNQTTTAVTMSTSIPPFGLIRKGLGNNQYIGRIPQINTSSLVPIHTRCAETPR
jgi:hypothetical protein